MFRQYQIHNDLRLAAPKRVNEKFIKWFYKIRIVMKVIKLIYWSAILIFTSTTTTYILHFVSLQKVSRLALPQLTVKHTVPPWDFFFLLKHLLLCLSLWLEQRLLLLIPLYFSEAFPLGELLRTHGAKNVVKFGLLKDALVLDLFVSVLVLLFLMELTEIWCHWELRLLMKHASTFMDIRQSSWDGLSGLFTRAALVWVV